jgi:site-specific DNA-cytosine methylase
MNILSLFDGMSCGQIALSRAGVKYNNYFASEIDEAAISITQKNFPKTMQLGDITNWRSWDLPKIDLIMGGSPCQGFSNAGKGLNFEDPRSKLFFVFVDILKTLSPKWFLLENVKMKTEWVEVINSYMGVTPILLNSSLVSAQNRERLYWTNIPTVFTIPKDKGILISDIKESNVDTKYSLTDKARAKIERYSNNYIVTGKSPTLTTELAHSTGSTITPKLIKEIGEDRRATPIECERLQTVPDNYTEGVSDTKRYFMLGNGWTVDIIVHLFKDLSMKSRGLFKDKQTVLF